jgi:hypothetical protein
MLFEGTLVNYGDTKLNSDNPKIFPGIKFGVTIIKFGVTIIHAAAEKSVEGTALKT